MSLLTRAEASKELENRGYTRLGKGLWKRPNGTQTVWFKAVSEEGIKFDRKDKPWKKL